LQHPSGWLKISRFKLPETTIFINWNLGPCLNQKPQVKKIDKAWIRDFWRPPQKGFIKLNFDGASKGNPGPAGAGGVFRNHKGEPLLFFATNLGITSNNAVEWWDSGEASK
jgi:hypothetical protein